MAADSDIVKFSGQSNQDLSTVNGDGIALATLLNSYPPKSLAIIDEGLTDAEPFPEEPVQEHIISVCGRGCRFPELDGLAESLSANEVANEMEPNEEIRNLYLREFQAICPPVAGISSPVMINATVRAAKRIFQ